MVHPLESDSPTPPRAWMTDECARKMGEMARCAGRRVMVNGQSPGLCAVRDATHKRRSGLFIHWTIPHQIEEGLIRVGPWEICLDAALTGARLPIGRTTPEVRSLHFARQFMVPATQVASLVGESEPEARCIAPSTRVSEVWEISGWNPHPCQGETPALILQETTER